MTNVFERLHWDSVTGKPGRSAQAIRSSREKEEQTWKLRLVAECRIVARSTTDSDDSPIRVSSLSSSSLHRRRRKPDSGFHRRSVSTLLSSDGSVQVTEHYLVKDSIEPPPYHVARVHTPRKLTVKREQPKGTIDIEPLRKQIEENRRKPIIWDTQERVFSQRLVDVDENGDDEPTREPRIMNDIHVPIDPKGAVPTALISATGHSWEDNGWPPSHSYFSVGL
jgi:hypothetical protein